MNRQQLLASLASLLLLASCEKKIGSETPAGELLSGQPKNDKILVCHREGNGSSHLITINYHAWPAHQQHGDVRLDDQDNDGFVPNNNCGYGNMGDCNDNDAAINPGATEICNGIDDNCNGIIDEGCSVTACNEVWMAKNLAVSTYRNGDPIPQVTNDAAWASLTTGAWCWYNNDSATYSVYGKLYNWYAVTDPRGLAPAGWHIPTSAELEQLGDCFGGSTVAGGALKEAGFAHWLNPNTGATNSSGLTALPAGFRYSTDGKFANIGMETYWWSTTACCGTDVWIGYLGFFVPNFIKTNAPQKAGLSVRCIKN